MRGSPRIAILNLMNKDITTQAEKIIEAAGQVGGAEEIARLATFGWPRDRALENDSFELRCAIQDEAKRVEASL